MFARLAVDANDRDPGMTSLAPDFALFGLAGKKNTLKIHTKSRFQPNEEIFAESCSVRYKEKHLRGYRHFKEFLNRQRMVVYKSRQPAKFAGFSARFRRLLSLLHESKYVEEIDPKPSTFHKIPAT